MELTEKEVEHIAHLSRIEISQEEKKNFSGQLSEILNYVALLNEVDTANVQETARVGKLSNVMSDDKVRISGISQSDLMSNAPDQYDNYFKVKTVLE